ncbi:MAG: HTH domain-containing protein [Myxococcota bacterium]
MTFFEAAVEVLRRNGRPLHYKKITEVAMRDSLLSHVGKEPENVMNDRLNQEVQKQKESVIVQTRPGVYTIRDGAMERVNAEAEKRVEQEKKIKEQQQKRTRHADADEKDDKDEKQSGNQRKQKQSTKSGGGSNKKSGGRQQARGSSEDGDKKRRRRRRSSRGGDKGGSKGGSNDRKKSKSRSRSRGGKSGKKSGSNRRGSGGSSKSKSKRRSSNKSNRRSSKSGAETTSPAVPGSHTRHLEEGPVRLNGIAEAAYKVLGDEGEAMDIESLAEEVFGRKLVKFHTHDENATVQAAMANDNQIRSQRGHRQLFVRLDRERWGLSEWALSSESVRKEQTILSLSEEIRQESIHQLGQALIDVQTEALEQIALTLLERLGYRNIKVSKRSSEGDVYFTADWRQGLSDVRVCIQVVSDGSDDLTQSEVSSLRGTLHHYSAAEGVIIHLGRIEPKAVNESREESVEPITLIDRETFVELLIRHGIGVRTYTTPITMVDSEFIEALKL